MAGFPRMSFFPLVMGEKIPRGPVHDTLLEPDNRSYSVASYDENMKMKIIQLCKDDQLSIKSYLAFISC